MSNVERAYPGEPVWEDIDIKRNDTFQWKFRGWASNGEPFNFDGYYFYMQIKENPDDEEALIEIPNLDFNKNWDEIGEEFDRLNIIEIQHPKEEMELDFGTYYYDIEMLTPDREIRQTIYEGNAHVTKDTTRINES